MADGPDLSGSVDLPAVGKVKKSYVAIAGAAVAGIVGWAWWSRRASAAPAAPSEPVADPRTGSEGSGGGYVNPGGIEPDPPSGDGAPRTDQEWIARALEKVTWYEPGFLSSALAKYLDKKPVKPAEADLIREVWAHVGKPPSGSIPIIPEGTTATPPTGVVLGAPTNLRVLGSTRDSVTLAWNPADNAKSYTVHRGPAPYSNYGVGLLTVMSWKGLKPNTAYTFSVRSKGADGQEKSSSVITARTAK